jgi:hypothetical protein
VEAQLARHRREAIHGGVAGDFNHRRHQGMMTADGGTSMLMFAAYWLACRIRQ